MLSPGYYLFSEIDIKSVNLIHTVSFDMEALKVEILNPKALQLINDLQELNLIKISELPSSGLVWRSVFSPSISGMS